MSRITEISTQQTLLERRNLTRKKKLKQRCLFSALILILGFSGIVSGQSRGWNKIPAVVVLGREGDSRNQLVSDAVDFWNKQLAEIGSGFRLGSITFISEIIPPEELVDLSKTVLDRGGTLEPPPSLMKIEGDLIIALSDGDFVSFAARFPNTGKRLIGIRSFQRPPFRFTNVGRNLIAHELGHAIGLGHNDGPANLMCGRPAPCRPDAFRSNVERYFPLTEQEKQFLLKLYPPTWK
jgi:hypothetical protein